MSVFNIANIIHDSIVDGPGMRISIFCQGCPHACLGCHNPQSLPFENNVLMSVQEVFENIQKNKLCKAVTFTGGEPFCQAKAFCALAKLLKAHGYEIASYTGYTFEELLAMGAEQEQLLNNIDVLIDGRFVLAKLNLSLSYRGSENQRIIDVKESLKAKKAVLSKDERWQLAGRE